MYSLLQITLEDDGTLKIESPYLEQQTSVKLNTPDRQEKRAPADDNYQDRHPELARALTLWRRAKAQEINVPAYYILHQRVLHAIADAAPQTEEELLALPGFGPGLFARYGEDILKLTAEVCPSSES